MANFTNLEIRIDTRSVNKAKDDVDRLRSSGKAAGSDLDGGFGKATRSANLLRGALAAVGVTLSARTIANYADEWTSASNLLRVVTKDTKELNIAQKDLLGLANDTRSSFSSSAELYSKLKRSTTELALSHTDLLGIVGSINKSFITSGASAQEVDGSIRQLAQGLAAGALRGDEFNSVAEGAPGIMRAISESLKLSVGDLREFAATGGITAEIVVKALQEASDSIENDFAKAEITLSQSLVVAKNNALEFVGSSERVQAVMSDVGQAIITVSENLDMVGNALATVFDGVGDVVSTSAIAWEGWSIDIERSINIVSNAFDGFLDGVELGSIDTVGLMELAFGSTLANIRDGLAATTVIVADAFARLGNEMSRGRISEEAYHARVAALHQAKIDTLDAILDRNKTTLESVYENINANREERRAQRELEESTDQVTESFGELTDETFAAWEAMMDLKHGTGEVIPVVQELDEVAQEYLSSLGLQEAQLHMTGRQLAVFNAVQEAGVGATEEQLAAIIRATEAIYDHGVALKQTEQDQKDQAKQAEIVAREMRDQWEDTRDFFSDSFVDLFENGNDAFDSLGKSFKKMVLKMVADWAASGLMKILGMGGGGPAGSGGFSLLTGGMGGGGGGAGSLLGLASAGLGGIGEAAATFGTTGGWVAPSMIAPSGGAAAGGLGGLGSSLATGAKALTQGATKLLASIPGWGWALAGIGTAAALMTKKSTPSHNAGFLTDMNVGLGKSGSDFATEQFASGLNIRGFNRRTEKGEAEGVIKTFRGLDSTLTELATRMGFSVDLNASNFSGLDEKGVRGVGGREFFFGHAGEEGKPGEALNKQIDSFTRQWVMSFEDQLSETDLAAILSGGDSQGMVEAFAAIVGASELDMESAKLEDKAAEEMKEAAEKMMQAAVELTLGQQRVAEENRLQMDYIRATASGDTVRAGNIKSKIDDLPFQFLDDDEQLDALYSSLSQGDMETSRKIIKGNETASGWVKDGALSLYNRNQGAGGTFFSDLETKAGQFGLSVTDVADMFGITDKQLAKNGYDGSHADGLASVPFNGYTAQLHQGERVVKASDNMEMTGMRSEISRLADTNEQLLSRLFITIKKFYTINDQWDKNGLPTERV